MQRSASSRKVLMIAYLFPPVGGIGTAGAQRVMKFAKYLPCYGWSPVVLTVREDAYEPYLTMDPSLVEKVPPNTTILRTGVFRGLSRALMLRRRVLDRFRKSTPTPLPAPSAAAVSVSEDGMQGSRWQRAKDALTDLFEIPDEEMGWFLPAVTAGLRAVRREGIQALYATGRPWTALVIGATLRTLTGLPLLVDFRDPWMTNPFRPEYSPLREHIESRLERFVVGRADLVIANTDELRAEFVRRWPTQPSEKFLILLNGYDPDDFVEESALHARNGRPFTIAHTGFLYGKRDPRSFLVALKRFVGQYGVDASNIRMDFVGSVELPYDLGGCLREHKLDGVVRVHGQVSYYESLDCLRRADLLLLLQPGTTTQVPSKLFEYVGMKKPILAISPRDGATWRLVRAEGLGEVADPGQMEDIVDTLGRLYERWECHLPLNEGRDGGASKFNVRAMTGELATRLADLSGLREAHG